MLPFLQISVYLQGFSEHRCGTGSGTLVRMPQSAGALWEDRGSQHPQDSLGWVPLQAWRAPLDESLPALPGPLLPLGRTGPRPWGGLREGLQGQSNSWAGPGKQRAPPPAVKLSWTSPHEPPLLADFNPYFSVAINPNHEYNFSEFCESFQQLLNLRVILELPELEAGVRSEGGLVWTAASHMAEPLSSCRARRPPCWPGPRDLSRPTCHPR